MMNSQDVDRRECFSAVIAGMNVRFRELLDEETKEEGVTPRLRKKVYHGQAMGECPFVEVENQPGTGRCSGLPFLMLQLHVSRAIVKRMWFLISHVGPGSTQAQKAAG